MYYHPTSKNIKKTKEELQQALEELAKEKFSLRIKRGSGLNPKPHLFKENKLSIARVKTLLKIKYINLLCCEMKISPLVSNYLYLIIRLITDKIFLSIYKFQF